MSLASGGILLIDRDVSGAKMEDSHNEFRAVSDRVHCTQNVDIGVLGHAVVEDM